jgi:hypothetical protein
VARPEYALESNPTLCVQKQTVVTVGASQQASAQNVPSEVRVVTEEVVVQAVHETTAIVVAIAMIAASAPRVQIVRRESNVASGPLAKIYHQ